MVRSRKSRVSRVYPGRLLAGLAVFCSCFLGAGMPARSQVAEELAATAPGPDEFPDEQGVILLLEKSFTCSPGGEMTEADHLVVKPLQAGRVVRYGKVTMNYNERFHDAYVDLVQSVLPGGEIGGLDEQGVKYSVCPHAASTGAMQYLKQLSVILPGAGVGSILESQLIRKDRFPLYDGKISGKVIFQRDDPVLEGRFNLRVPKGTKVKFVYHELRDRVKKESSGEWDEYKLVVEDMPKTPEERFRPSDDEIAAAVFFTSFRDWDDVADWFNRRFDSVTVVDSTVKRMVRVALAGREQGGGKVGRLYQYLCDKLDFLPVLDRWEQGFPLDRPGEIVESGYGDSFQFAVVFLAMLREAGIKAYPVLLNIGGVVDTTAACPQQFNHCLVAVERPEGGLVFLDPSSRGSDFGVLPGATQGRQALILFSRKATWTILPVDPPEKSTELIDATFKLDKRGDLSGSMSLKGTGNIAKGWRDFFLGAGKMGRKAALSGRMPLAVSGGRLVGINVEEYKSLFKPVQFEIEVEATRYARRVGRDTLLFSIPPCFTVLIPNFLGQIVWSEDRQLPYDLGMVMPAFRLEKTVKVKLPGGYRLGIPKVRPNVSNSLGQLKVSYELDRATNTLTYRLLLVVSALRIQPEKYGELRELLMGYAQEIPRELICLPGPD